MSWRSWWRYYLTQKKRLCKLNRLIYRSWLHHLLYLSISDFQNIYSLRDQEICYALVSHGSHVSRVANVFKKRLFFKLGSVWITSQDSSEKKTISFFQFLSYRTAVEIEFNLHFLPCISYCSMIISIQESKQSTHSSDAMHLPSPIPGHDLASIIHHSIVDGSAVIFNILLLFAVLLRSPPSLRFGKSVPPCAEILSGLTKFCSWIRLLSIFWAR